MGSSMPLEGVEDGRGKSGSLLDPTLDTPDQGALFEPPELTPEEFLRRLVRREFKKAVALAYYPPKDKRSGRELKGEPLEHHIKNAIGNIDRMLEGHNPPTLRLLDCCRKVIPGAGVAIAHFYADRGGTERGTPKLDTIRLQDEILAIRASIERSDAEKQVAMRRLAMLQDFVAEQRGRR